MRLTSPCCSRANAGGLGGRSTTQREEGVSPWTQLGFVDGSKEEIRRGSEVRDVGQGPSRQEGQDSWQEIGDIQQRRRRPRGHRGCERD